jgi:hypothetical protein
MACQVVLSLQPSERAVCVSVWFPCMQSLTGFTLHDLCFVFAFIPMDRFTCIDLMRLDFPVPPPPPPFYLPLSTLFPNSLVTHAAIHCLGNGKPEVRAQALTTLIQLMHVFGIDEIFEYLSVSAKHANANVRESVLLCYIEAMKALASSMSFGNVLPVVLSLLNDRGSEVREAAVMTLEVMYQHVGEPLIHELHTKMLRPAQLKPILDRFTMLELVPAELRVALYPSRGSSKAGVASTATATRPSTAVAASRQSVVTAAAPSGAAQAAAPRPSSAQPRASISMPAGSGPTSPVGAHRASMANSNSTSGFGIADALDTTQSRTNVSGAAGSASGGYRARALAQGRLSMSYARAGSDPLYLPGVDDDEGSAGYASVPSGYSTVGRLSTVSSVGTFSPLPGAPAAGPDPALVLRTAAEDVDWVPLGAEVRMVKLYTEKEIEKEIGRLGDVLKDDRTASWKERVAALHRICALVAGGAAEFDNFPTMLYNLKDGLSMQIQDLRSAVAKEACAVVCTYDVVGGAQRHVCVCVCVCVCM